MNIFYKYRLICFIDSFIAYLVDISICFKANSHAIKTCKI